MTTGADDEPGAEPEGPHHPGHGEHPKWAHPAPDPLRRAPVGGRGPDDPFAPWGPSAGRPDRAGPPRPANGPGTAALVLGVLGLCLSVVPLIGLVAWPLTILAVVFGAVGMKRADRGAATNRGQAVSGLITGLIGLAICAAWLLAFVASRR